MYFMHLWKRAEEKNHANKKQSPQICFTAVKLSTLWMIYSRGNNKRNSWSNYQPDKNALNFKKGFRLEAPATNPASWVSGIGDTSSSPDCRTAAVSAGTQPHSPFKQEVSKFCLRYRQDLKGTLLLLGICWEEVKGKEPQKQQKKKGRHQKHALHLLFMINSHATLQQNAVNIDFINANKGLSAALYETIPKTRQQLGWQLLLGEKGCEFQHFKYTTWNSWVIFLNHSLINKT